VFNAKRSANSQGQYNTVDAGVVTMETDASQTTIEPSENATPLRRLLSAVNQLTDNYIDGIVSTASLC